MKKFFKKAKSDINKDKAEEKKFKNHPLMKNRQPASSQEIVSCLPPAKNDPPLEQLKEMYEEISKSGEGISLDAVKRRDKPHEESEGSRPEKSAHVDATSKSSDRPQTIASSIRPPNLMTVPLKDDTTTSSKLRNESKGTEAVATLTPSSSSNAFVSLEAHKILTTDGYFTFKAPSPVGEKAHQLGNTNEKLEQEATNAQQNTEDESRVLTRLSERDTTLSVPTIQRSTSSILARLGEALTPSQLQELIQRAIVHHEQDRLKAAFQLYCITAQQGLPIGLFLTGLALRHGWGCDQDQKLALACLEHSAQIAAKNLKLLRTRDDNTETTRDGQKHEDVQIPNFADKKGRGSISLHLIPENEIPYPEKIHAQIAKNELAMSIYELGQCYRFGWGVAKSKPTAVFYFKIAADLGDSDAQIDLANCYNNGTGVKSDRYMAASYFRLAALQGKTEFGLSWIYKDKYDKFFHEKFPAYAALEDKRRNVQPTEENVPSKKDKNPLSYLKALQQKVYSASQ